MDRQYLAAWACRLADKDFPSALAALGVLAAARRAGAPELSLAGNGLADAGSEELADLFFALYGAGTGRLEWRAPGCRGARLAEATKFPAATVLREAWQTFRTRLALSQALPPRLVVRREPPPARALRFAQVLARPEAGAGSVCVVGGSAAPRPTGWAWPLTIASLRADPLAGELLAAQDRQPAESPACRFTTVDRVDGQVEVLVCGSALAPALAKLLAGDIRLRSSLIVVRGLGSDSPATADPLINALLARFRTTGIVIAECGGSEAGFVARLADFARQIADSQPLDVALCSAFDGRLLSVFNSDLPLRIGFGQAAARTRDVDPPAVAPRVARHLQQRSYRRVGGRFTRERRGYVAGEAVLVRFFIGPLRKQVTAAPTAFPENELPAGQIEHSLQLILHEPQHFERPMLGEIVLPPAGDSNPAEFIFVPRSAGDFSARLTVLHRGRVLQTVFLCAPVVEAADLLAATEKKIALLDEAMVREDWSELASRRRYDMALVLDQSPSGQAQLTGVAGRRAWATDLSSIEEPVRAINDLISSVASKVADHADGLDQGDNPALLVQLARVGADLYSSLYVDQLQELNAGGLDVGSESLTHIQVLTTRADAVVPIEFFYDYPPPDEDAQVCPQHQAALRSGECAKDCARLSAPARYVCPLGFWGLKKVIERHFFNAALGKPDGAELVILAEPAAGRSHLDPRAGVLLAHSQEIAEDEVRDLIATLDKSLPGKLVVAHDWDEWKRGVMERPGLLLAFPHNEGTRQNVRLEIGGALLPTLRLPAEYVRSPDAPPPLVMLLGCDTASTAEDYANHVRYFRQAGAAVVVSTIATVFGPQAVAVGEKIVKRLVGGEEGKFSRLGELIRDAKREALGESVPMALCVVAFGDADWQL